MAILTYNQVLVRQYLNTYQFGELLFKDILSPAYSKDYFRQYDRMFNDHFNVFIDRTGTIPHYLDVKIDLLPELNSYLPFEQCVEIRAKELLASGKTITVLWSGGLDSTFVLLALMNYATDLKQIQVFGTYGSVLESGGIFDKYIKDRVQCTIRVGGEDAPELEEDTIIVSGMLGNQIFGPEQAEFTDKGNKRFGKLGSMDLPFEQFLTEEQLKFLQPAIEIFPRKIKTLAEFRWFMSFNFLWQHIRYEPWVHFPKHIAEKVDGFFNTVDFQTWAIKTDEPWQLDQTNDLTHRWQMRQLINKWIGPNDYADQKIKAVSVLLVKKPAWGYMLDNYNNIFLKDHFNA